MRSLRRLARPLAVFLATCALAACGGGSAPQASPAGRWVFDEAKTLDDAVSLHMKQVASRSASDFRGGVKPDEAQIRALVAEKLSQVKIDVDLRADGTAVMDLRFDADSRRQEGVWEAKGDEVHLRATVSGGAPATGPDAETQKFKRKDGGLVMHRGASAGLWLRRG